ncbi:NAD(+) diphosphatase [Paraneptunicella aestuarii]|uniref:NAD(+) diphosphatase n=1 Tax=Paraneptunicella aestuarii TaxID=2831148 RepID=UPI001E587BA0|nr:NAD(+) diphosphatase [Paraneptunicella aestuarii]UAA38958.1 NAD(+) diphosphatase [Paraneptunicella aestuarii]
MMIYNPDIKTTEHAHWLVVSGSHLVINAIDNSLIEGTWEKVPFIHEYRNELVQVGEIDGKPCYLVDMGSEQIESDELTTLNLRAMMMQMGVDWFSILARAWQVALFLRTHRFCGQCGSRMEHVGWEMAMQCHTCSHRCYPRVSPCIIVAIRDGERILLAQGRNHKNEMHSTLAGFVESGESLEEAVHREVFEEVGVKVKNLEYFSSQPWPFPHSLMVGFLAEYDSGDIQVDGDEILRADWFTADNLPNIPPTFSIAGQLIQETLKKMK